MLETLGEDYILTARAKGLKPWTIVRRHALRNAMLPIATLVALSLGYIVAGAILIETVFSWPGIGRAVYDAVLQRDYPMLQGAFLVAHDLGRLLQPRRRPPLLQARSEDHASEPRRSMIEAPADRPRARAARVCSGTRSGASRPRRSALSSSRSSRLRGARARDRAVRAARRRSGRCSGTRRGSTRSGSTTAASTWSRCSCGARGSRSSSASPRRSCRW